MLQDSDKLRFNCIAIRYQKGPSSPNMLYILCIVQRQTRYRIQKRVKIEWVTHQFNCCWVRVKVKPKINTTLYKINKMVENTEKIEVRVVGDTATLQSNNTEECVRTADTGYRKRGLEKQY